MLKKQDQLQNTAALKIQCLYRRATAYRQFKKLKKILTYRKHIIKQFIDTEEQYVYDISLIISDFKYPLRSSKLLQPAEVVSIFSNIEQIKKLNEQLYCELYNRFQKYHHYKVMFDIVIKMSPFFKIYFEYCKNYMGGINIITNLKEQRKGFKEFIDHKEQKPQFRRLSIDGFLIKPIQRLPKYLILLKDLIKHTPYDHPDYKNILRALTEFEKVNSNNNESMNKVLNNLKIIELQNIINSPLLQPCREFICEEAVSFLKWNTIKDAIMYLFNDMIVLTRKTRNGEQLELKLLLNRASFVNDVEDLKYFKNMFLVSGQDGECCTLACSSFQQKQKLMNLISKTVASVGDKQISKARLFLNSNIKSESIIKKISQTDNPVEVNVIGTEERNSTKFTKYTVYIIQVKIKNINQKIFLRFNDLLQIQSFVWRKFENDECFKTLRNGNILSNNNWLSNHQSKVIEHRKLNIQQFLQKLLNIKEMRQNGHQILVKLGLPEDFYLLPEKYRLSGSSKSSSLKQSFFQRCSSASIFQKFESPTGSLIESLQEEQDQESNILKRKKKLRNNSLVIPHQPQQHRKKSLSVEELLQANEMYLGHFTRISEKKDKFLAERTDSNVTMKILICCQSLQYSTLQIQIQKYQRVSNLIVLVAKHINLKYYRDFRFFLQQGDTIRILDDDELVDTIYNEVNKFFSSAKLIFKKFIYINREIEDREIKSDKVRMNLISNQILEEIKTFYFKLSYQDYLIFLSFTLMLNKCHVSNKLLIHLIKKFLPEEVFKEFTETEWIKDTTKCYEIVSNYLEKIQRTNQTKKELYKQNIKNVQLSEIRNTMTQLDSLIRLAIINQIEKHFLYGVSLTIVHISESTQKQFAEEHGIEIDARNIWLGLKHNKIMFISINLKKILKQFSYSEAEDLLIYPASLTLVMKVNEQSRKYKLKTTKSFFLSQLILYYKNYNEIYEKIIKDNNYEPIEKTKQHMESLVIEQQQFVMEQSKGQI